MTAIIVIAKETIPGRVKTRLHPPFSLEQAAELAAASLSDTLRAVSTLGASERILYVDGTVLPAGSEGYRVIPQTSGTLDERLAAVFDRMIGPALLVGMDTPQLSHRHLAHVFENWPSDIDAWFGPAEDGGFWALGLREPNGDLIRGVPMSQDDTGVRQRERLDAAGLRVALLPTLTDVDTIDSAAQVAAIAPETEFARTMNRFDVRQPVRARQRVGAIR
jgi:glycosyltransferase A (GT-A) superfamily protein (DUF2064 family)